MRAPIFLLRSSRELTRRSRPARRLPSRSGRLLALLLAGASGATAFIFAPPIEPRLDAQVVGVIRGRVDIRQPLPRLARRPGIADFGMAAPRSAPDRRRAVVYLETAPRAAFEGREEPPPARLDQRNETFIPHVLAVMVGTRVDFPNNDRTYHNVFSLSRAKPFDLGRYPAGRAKSVVFDRPGIVRVFCEIHSHMNAFILVFAHRYFSVADENGRYRIDNVPPGNYTVSVWTESLPVESRPVRVPDTGGDVELNFVIPREESE